MRRFVGLTGAALLLMGMAVLAQGDAKLVDQGKKVYDGQKCADCHTIAGRGGRLTKQFKLDGVGTKLPAADLRLWLTDPAAMEAKLAKPAKLKMSSKKYEFKGQDLEALVAYMLTLK